MNISSCQKICNNSSIFEDASSIDDILMGLNFLEADIQKEISNKTKSSQQKKYSNTTALKNDIQDEAFSTAKKTDNISQQCIKDIRNTKQANKQRSESTNECNIYPCNLTIKHSHLDDNRVWSCMLNGKRDSDANSSLAYDQTKTLINVANNSTMNNGYSADTMKNKQKKCARTLSVQNDNYENYQIPVTGINCGTALVMLIEQNRVDFHPRWCLVEHYSDLRIERFCEDHELMEDCIGNWSDINRCGIRFTDNQLKVDVFLRPEKYLLTTQESKSKEWNHKKRSQLILSYFQSPDYVKILEFGSYLWLRNNTNNVWKKHYFISRPSGLYYTQKGKNHQSSDLRLYTILERVNIYYGYGWKSAYKSPTNYGFALKVANTCNESNGEIHYFCTDSKYSLQRWITLLRISKFGYELWTNYKYMVNKTLSARQTYLFESATLPKSSNNGSLLSLTSASSTTNIFNNIPSPLTPTAVNSFSTFSTNTEHRKNNIGSRNGRQVEMSSRNTPHVKTCEKKPNKCTKPVPLQKQSKNSANKTTKPIAPPLPTNLPATTQPTNHQLKPCTIDSNNEKQEKQNMHSELLSKAKSAEFLKPIVPKEIETEQPIQQQHNLGSTAGNEFLDDLQRAIAKRKNN